MRGWRGGEETCDETMREETLQNEIRGAWAQRGKLHVGQPLQNYLVDE